MIKLLSQMIYWLFSIFSHTGKCVIAKLRHNKWDKNDLFVCSFDAFRELVNHMKSHIAI